MITTKERTRMLKDYGDVLTVKDVMKILLLGEKTVRRMIREGKIKSLFYGQKYIIPKVYLIEFLSDENNFTFSSQKSWTCEQKCDIVVSPAKDTGKGQESSTNTNEKEDKK